MNGLFARLMSNVNILENNQIITVSGILKFRAYLTMNKLLINSELRQSLLFSVDKP